MTHLRTALGEDISYDLTERGLPSHHSEPHLQERSTNEERIHSLHLRYYAFIFGSLLLVVLLNNRAAFIY